MYTQTVTQHSAVHKNTQTHTHTHTHTSSQGRDFARFYVLETVARVPYSSYMSVLHFYETMGLHRKAYWIKVHFGEADNELHHVLSMESLGGNDNFADGFFAEHVAA
jgi:ubiquinol oxidase